MKMKKDNFIVYKAENMFTGECYFGATTKSIDERKQDHLQKAFARSDNEFHNAIATIGADNFIWEQLDTASDSNELAEKECSYIYEFKLQGPSYNSDRGRGIKKKVYQYNEDGFLIEAFDGLTEIKEVLGFEKQRISHACINLTKYSGSYWSYNLSENIIPRKDLRVKSVNQFSLRGELIESFDSASEASRKTGVSKTCITRCCRSERERSGGFLWEYI